MGWFGEKAQPKEGLISLTFEAKAIYAVCGKCQCIYEQEAGHKCIFPLGCSGLVNPPLGGSVIARSPCNNPSIIVEEYR